MKVKALKGFTAFVGEDSVSASEGQVLEMPAGADWIKAGLAIAVEGELPDVVAPETAAFEPAEAAVPAAARKRKPK
jgi:hypothetical protein